MSDDPIRLYAEYIIDAPDEWWTPHFTRSELLPMARAYIENEKLRERLEEIKRLASDPFASESVALRACLLAAYEGLGLPGAGDGSRPSSPVAPDGPNAAAVRVEDE